MTEWGVCLDRTGKAQAVALETEYFTLLLALPPREQISLAD